MLGKLTHVFQVMISHSLSLKAFSHCFPILSHAIRTLAELILTCIPLNNLGTVICHISGHYRHLKPSLLFFLSPFSSAKGNLCGREWVKLPSHGKLKLANSCWQTQAVGVCERHKNSRQTRFYLTPTVCKRVCRLFLSRPHTPTWICQHEFANLSLPCEGRFNEALSIY